MPTRTRRDGGRHVDPFADRRRRYNDVLRTLGLADAFGRLNRRVQEAIWRCKSPDPLLEFSPSFPADPKLRRQLQQAIHDASVEIEGTTLPARDFMSVVIGLKMIIDAATQAKSLQPEAAQFIHQSKPIIERLFSCGFGRALSAMETAAARKLLAASRLDSRLLHILFAPRPCAAGKHQMVITATADEAQVAYVTMDGDSRPAYRVGSGRGMGLKWITWDGPSMGLPGEHVQYPVYVQRHALHQLRTRVNLPDVVPYLESWLAESLETPKVVEHHGRQLWIEFRVLEHRLGYLIARVVGDKVVVRTFLFLTMQAAPEGRMIRERTGLSTREVDWLRLTDLSAFTQTDLRQDAELQKLFEACGCGQLFKLADEDCSAAPEAFAADLRRYLGMAA